MKKRTRYLVLMIAVVALVALMLALPTAVMAKEGNNGNHAAVWSLDLPMHGLDSGTAWGPTVSDLASSGELQGGVSEGVHEAKENGWNK